MANKAGSIGNIRKKIAHTHDLISTSHHESGHVIYGLLYNMKIDSVSVFENKKNNRVEGLTLFDKIFIYEEIRDQELLSYIINAEICFKYAGLTAEKNLFKLMSGSDKFPMFLRDGSSDDTLSAAALIKQYNVVPPGKKRYSYKKRIINEILHELQEHWEAVTIVSHALFHKRKLTFFDLKKLLTQKTSNREFWKNKFKLIETIYNNPSIDEETCKYLLKL